ncbi:MAG: SRPBCC family protein [Bacteroidota bacterium]
MKNNITSKVSDAISTPVSKVWDALTKPELIKLYFFGTEAVSDWKKGSPIIFKGEWEGKSYQDKGTIMDIEPNKLFRYNYWSSLSGIEDISENYVTITYELEENGDNTILTITQENIPDEKMKEHLEQNWNKVLNDLKELLEKGLVTYV